MFRMLLKASVFFILLGFGLFSLISSSMSQGGEVWTNLNLYGGQIYDIAIDPNNPDKIFVGSNYGDGLFLSEDGGNTWKAVLTGHEGGELDRQATFRNTEVLAIKIAPIPYNNVIWVAHDKWVEKSTNGGQTWTHIYNHDMQRDCINCGGEGDDFRFCRSLAINPLDPQTVYVGAGGPVETDSSGAIYKTEDGGMTWIKMNINSGPFSDTIYPVVDLAIDLNNPEVVWALTYSFGTHPTYKWLGSLYRTEDGGNNWSWMFSLTGSCNDLEVKPNDSNTIFIANYGGIIRFCYDQDPNKRQFDNEVVPSSGNVRALAFDPQDPEILYAAWRCPWTDNIPMVGRSSNGGIDWEMYTVEYQFINLAVHPSNSAMIFGGEFSRGVYRSEDCGENWIPINNGINAVKVYDIDINPNNSSHILVATSLGVYAKKGETDWKLISDFEYKKAYSIKFHLINSQIFYAGIEGLFAKTTDGGENWSFSNVLDASGDNYNYVKDIAIYPTNIDPNTTVIFIAVANFDMNYGEIYKSIDGGDTFDKVLDGENLSGKKYVFNTLAIDPSNPNHIFAGGGNFNVPKILGDLWETTDMGASWTRTSLKDVIVNAILIDSSDPNIMYAGCGYSAGTDIPIYKSLNGGNRWIQSYNGIPIDESWNAVTDLAIHPRDRNIIYASTFGAGVYVSPNQGGYWMNLGTPKFNVFAIATSSLYAATEGGLWQCTGTGVISGQVIDGVFLSGIHGATVFNDIGIKSISINGEYMMVSPSGIFDVTAIAKGFANKTIEDINVYGGDISWVDFVMQTGSSEPYTPEDENSSGDGGGSIGCFIATVARFL